MTPTCGRDDKMTWKIPLSSCHPVILPPQVGVIYSQKLPT